MNGISKKLLRVIGGQSAKSWAEKNGLPVQTVHEWIKHDRMPRGANLQLLINVTGIPKEWWVSDNDSLPIETLANDHSKESEKTPPAINKELFNTCLDACQSIYGTMFTSSLVSRQVDYVADCYNILVEMTSNNPNDPNATEPLSKEDFIHLLTISVKLGRLHAFAQIK
ncbi:hypothetical protein LG200_06075 [Methylobacillus caricis]|uniref:hypothetical protein n=1 Tax=Methylobacillus caricis TaxID=1971611 RepID=UPI001D0000F2|nr:hypothetical protein [Methylobacillus caricis]MCB5187573.1 hypothetical protein [Methylobacillus caricis]